MLRRIVRVASSRITVALLAVWWAFELFGMIDNGWEWEETERTPQGVVIRHKSWDITRTEIFVWLTLILLGYVAHWFKRFSLGYYGLLEVVVGLVGGSLAVAKLPLNQAVTWLTMGGASYVVVRGVEHIQQALAIEDTEKAATPRPDQISN
jgi:hypothetical protein